MRHRKLALLCNLRTALPAAIRPLVTWALGAATLAACVGQSCSQTPIVPSEAPADQVPDAQPKNPAVDHLSDDETPYDETEFPVESPTDMTNPLSLTITASAWSGRAPFLVAFFAGTLEGGRVPTGLIWDFGDGTTAEGLRVQHTFENEGLYKVTVCPGPTTPSAEHVSCGQGFVQLTAPASGGASSN